MAKFKGIGTGQKVPQWLLTIQENSWEAELLLSAVMLFGLIQTPIFLESWANQLFAWEDGTVKSVLTGLIAGIEILRIGFILHLIVRALWIAQVGFSYVYPKGIRIDKLKFKGRFRDELSNSDSMVKSIIRLEKIASMVFAISFSLLGLLVGMMFFVSPIIIIALILATNESESTLKGVLITFMVVYMLLSFPVFIDFITNGILRRGKRRAKYFYPLSFFYRIMTLSFLYKKTLLTVISNVEGYKRYLITIGIVLLVIFLDSPSQYISDYKRDVYKENMKNGFIQKSNYESFRQKGDILKVTIPTDVIENGVLKIFVKDQVGLSLDKDKIVKEKKDTTEKARVVFTNKAETESIADKAAQMNELLAIYIDDHKINPSKWSVSIHPSEYKKGFISFINIDSLTSDLHYLKVSLAQPQDSFPFKPDSLLANIAFYKR